MALGINRWATECRRGHHPSFRRGHAGDVLEVECASIAYASEVFHAIRNGKKHFSDILSYIAVESGRTQLARTLKAMLEAGLLIKRYPINNDSPKAAFYEVSGNAMRFLMRTIIIDLPVSDCQIS